MSEKSQYKWKPVGDPRFNCMAGIGATSLLPRKLIALYQEYEKEKHRSMSSGNYRCPAIKKTILDKK